MAAMEVGKPGIEKDPELDQGRDREESPGTRQFVTRRHVATGDVGR